MVEIWETKIKKEKADKLPVIIPLVVYHGKNRWKTGTSLGEMIAGYKDLPEDIKKFTPNYEYLLYDLSRYTDDEIKGEAQLRILLTTFRDIFTKDSKGLQESIFRAISYLQELDDKQTGIEYFETLMRYIFNARADLTKADFNAVVKKIETTYPEGSEVVMTLAEQLREEGEAKALARTAIRLLTKKFGFVPEELKMRISQLDAPTLDVMIDGILDYESLEEVKRYLQ